MSFEKFERSERAEITVAMSSEENPAHFVAQKTMFA